MTDVKLSPADQPLALIEGKGYAPGAKGAEKNFLLYFPLCWSVGEWAGASWVSPPCPPGWGVGQVLWVPPCRFSPPPPPPGLLRKALGATTPTWQGRVIEPRRRVRGGSCREGPCGTARLVVSTGSAVSFAGCRPLLPAAIAAAGPTFRVPLSGGYARVPPPSRSLILAQGVSILQDRRWAKKCFTCAL